MSEFLYRRNTVLEALRSGRRRLIRLWLQEGLPADQNAPLLAQAKERGAPVKTAAKGELSQMTGDPSHQGVVLEVGAYPYSDVDSMLRLAAARGEKPLLLLLDLVQGPQNVGLLLRTAEGCGAHGVILQERRSPEVTPQVAIFSTGASEHLLIAQVTNLVQTIQQLQREDVWMMGLDLNPAARPLGQVDLNIPLGIVVGNEGSGLRRLVRERCDLLVRLPMRGRLESFNAAVAGSLVLYAAGQSRSSPTQA
ncbi:MAG: 23S rRNA (guanosine(2251)-2'-O)-methyltransferase RlmB [Chloroflexota bacterium]